MDETQFEIIEKTEAMMNIRENIRYVFYSRAHDDNDDDHDDDDDDDDDDDKVSKKKGDEDDDDDDYDDERVETEVEK
jgi:hypothetical protein